MEPEDFEAETVEWYGVKIPPGKTVVVNVNGDGSERRVFHPTQVALGEKPKPGRHVLFAEIPRGDKIVIGTLEMGRCEQFQVDYMSVAPMTFSHTGPSPVFISGYNTVVSFSMDDDDEDDEDDKELRELLRKQAEGKRKQLQANGMQQGANGEDEMDGDEDEDMDDSDEEEEEDDEDEDEEAPALVLASNPAQQAAAYDDEDDEDEEEDEDGLDDEDDEDEEDEGQLDDEVDEGDDEDEDEEDEDEEDNEDEEDDEFDDEEEDEEPAVPAAAGGKRAKAMAATPQPAKRAKTEATPAAPKTAPAKVPTSKPAAGGGAPADAAGYLAALKEHLRTKGATAMSSLGSSVKRPSTVPKLKKFLEDHKATFKVDPSGIVSLA